MPVFKDSTGAEWDIEVNGGTVRRARSLLQIDIGKPRDGDNPWLVRFEQDIEFKVNLLYVVCMPQIRQRELNDDQFAERLSGDALRDASLAFYVSLLDFFQSLGQTDDAIAIQVMIASLPEVYGVAAKNASMVVVDILGTLYVYWQQQQDVTQSLEPYVNSM